jgi:hypothetical protein
MRGRHARAVFLVPDPSPATALFHWPRTGQRMSATDTDVSAATPVTFNGCTRSQISKLPHRQRAGNALQAYVSEYSCS